MQGEQERKSVWLNNLNCYHKGQLIVLKFKSLQRLNTDRLKCAAYIQMGDTFVQQQ